MDLNENDTFFLKLNPKPLVVDVQKKFVLSLLLNETFYFCDR